MRTALAIMILLLAACEAPYERPKSICELPRTLAGWSGTDVRWQGVIVGGYHGYAMVAEDCQRRGISVTGWRDTSLDMVLRERGLKNGLLRVDVTGKIIERNGNFRLLVKKVHRVAFEPMSYEQEMAFWTSKGF